jgi:hypothetical protein
MANNMMQLLTDVPVMLIAAWTAWFIAGGMLAMWYRRASLEAEFAPLPAPPRTVARPRPATPSAFAVSAPVEHEPSVTESSPVFDEPPVAARDKRAAKPIVVGDPYGDLATLLDQPQTAPPQSNRAPGDSPILNSAGSPIQRPND